MFDVPCEKTLKIEPACDLWTFWNIFLRERKKVWGSVGGQRERENPKQVPCSAQSPTWGPIPRPWDPDLRQNQGRSLNHPSHPDAPDLYIFLRLDAYQLHDLKIFSPTPWVVCTFHFSGDRFLWLQPTSRTVSPGTPVSHNTYIGEELLHVGDTHVQPHWPVPTSQNGCADYS